MNPRRNQAVHVSFPVLQGGETVGSVESTMVNQPQQSWLSIINHRYQSLATIYRFQLTVMKKILTIASSYHVSGDLKNTFIVKKSCSHIKHPNVEAF